MSIERNHFRGRTDAKLRYAELTLGELRAYKLRGSGDDFERGHHEAFLFHLMGVEDALLQELNIQYRCGLTLKEVKRSCLSKKMATRNHKNAALNDLKRLHKAPTSWLREAKEYRDHGTHRQHIPRNFARGGHDNGIVRFRQETGQLMGTDVLDAFADWLTRMKQLVEKGRL